jgi:hypothetical protein
MSKAELFHEINLEELKRIQSKPCSHTGYWYKIILKKQCHPDYLYLATMVNHFVKSPPQPRTPIFVLPTFYAKSQMVCEYECVRWRISFNSECWWCPQLLRRAFDAVNTSKAPVLVNQMNRIMRECEVRDKHQTQMLKTALGYILLIVFHLRKKKPKIVVKFVLDYLL